MKVINDAVAEVDTQINLLQMVRKVLTGLDGYVATKPWARRQWAKAGTTPMKAKGKRKLSKQAIARIRKAQKERWAKWHAAQAGAKAKGKKA